MSIKFIDYALKIGIAAKKERGFVGVKKKEKGGKRMETEYGGEYKIKVSDIEGSKSGNQMEIAKAAEKAISEALKKFYSEYGNEKERRKK